MKISEQEFIDRKNRIIMCAFSLFCEKGIEQVSLADIAKKAKVGNSTIYRYFTNKPQLTLNALSLLWKSIEEDLENTIQKTVDYDKKTGLEQIAVWFGVFKNLYLVNRDYVLFSYEAKLYLQRNNITITNELYDSLMETIKDPCIATIEKGKKDGSIKAKSDSEDLFYAIWGSIRGYIVKIVIYKALCQDGGPWEKRYKILEEGILCALSTGWKVSARPIGERAIIGE